MATTGRPNDPDVSGSAVEAELREEPYLFEFFQAVRLLERLFPGQTHPWGGSILPLPRWSGSSPIPPWLFPPAKCNHSNGPKTARGG